MFLGEYEYRIDRKGRVSVPPKFREEFRSGIIVTRGYERCIVAYTLSEWNKLYEMYATFPTTSSSSRLISRVVFSSAFDLTLDRLGRLILPPPLRAYAQVQEDVVIAGVGSYLEIWSKEGWEREQDVMEEKATEIADGLSQGL